MVVCGTEIVSQISDTHLTPRIAASHRCMNLPTHATRISKCRDMCRISAHRLTLCAQKRRSSDRHYCLASSFCRL